MAQGKNYRVGLLITGDAKGGIQAVKLTRQEIERLDRSQRQAEKAQKRYAANQKLITANMRTFLSVGKAAVAIYATMRLSRVADEYRLLESRIRLATEATGDYARVSKQLYEISQSNGVAMRESVGLFQNLARSAPEVGATTKEVLTLTNSLQQLGVVSGATQEAMSNSLRQFSQAMAGGVLRAEEWNSIVENTPAIAEAIAKGLGKSIGQLRLMVLEGEVLSKDVFQSILSQTDEISESFSKMPLTVDRAGQMLGTSFQRVLGVLNEAGGATGSLAESIKSMSVAMDTFAEGVLDGTVAAELSIWRETLDTVGEGIDLVQGKIDGLRDGVFSWSDFWMDLPAMGHIAFAEVFGMIDRGLLTIKTLWRKLVVYWDEVWSSIKTRAEIWWETIKGVFRSEEAQQEILSAIRENEKAEQESFARRLRMIDEYAEGYRAQSLAIVESIRAEQEARMSQRKAMVGVNEAIEELIDSNDDLFGFQSAVVDQTIDVNEQLTTEEEKIRAIITAQSDLRDSYDKMKVDSDFTLKIANDRLDELNKGYEESGTIFDDMVSGMQDAWTAFWVDIVSGKGIDSVKDFFDTVKNLFIQLLAEMAAAWTQAKIFKWLGISGGGGSGGSIAGIGKAIAEKIGLGGGSGGGSFGGLGTIAAAGKKVASWLGFGGQSASTAGAFGSVGVNPATMASGSGWSGAASASSGASAASGSAWGSAAGAAVVAAIAAYGFSAQSKKKRERAERQAEFFEQVGTGTSEQLGEGAWDFRGNLNDAEAFFSTTRAGWQSTAKALMEANAASKVWGASLDENGRGLVKIRGNVDEVKTALSNATATGYHFSGSLSNAIEKGNSLRVSILGDADAIKQALNAATAAGIGGFVGLQETATGVSATLTGDIQRWDDYLQSFVNASIQAAVDGVGMLGDKARSATDQFANLARVAGQIKVGSGGSTISLKDHAKGGVSYRPAIFGEAGPEAAVPLPDGRSIPVKLDLKGSSGQSTKEMERLLAKVNQGVSTMVGLLDRAALAAEASERRLVAANWGGR